MLDFSSFALGAALSASLVVGLRFVWVRKTSKDTIVGGDQVITTAGRDQQVAGRDITNVVADDSASLIQSPEDLSDRGKYFLAALARNTENKLVVEQTPQACRVRLYRADIENAHARVIEFSGPEELRAEVFDAYEELLEGGILGEPTSDRSSQHYRLSRHGRSLARKFTGDFPNYWESMGDLLQEMIKDLISPEGRRDGIREFVLRNENGCFSPEYPVFHYFYESHPNLIANIKILERSGLVREIHKSNIPWYEMEEDFVLLLKVFGNIRT